jgi:hypothetical protein
MSWKLSTLDACMTEGGFDGFDIFVRTILPIFPSLKKVRIFGKDSMNWQITHEEIEMDFCSFDYFDEMTDFD